MTPDGWFSTGDIGRLDEDGYLIITDRKKELLKTAGGKFVAPAPIENLLKTSPYIPNAIVVGDKRKFVSVLVVVNVRGQSKEARKAGNEFQTPTQMLTDPWVRDLLHAGNRAAHRASRAVRKAEAVCRARAGFHVCERGVDVHVEIEAPCDRRTLRGYNRAALRRRGRAAAAEDGVASRRRFE